MKPPPRVLALCGERSGDAILKRVCEAAGPKQFVGAVWSPEDDGHASSEQVSRVPILFDGPSEFGVMGFGPQVWSKIPRAYYRMKQVESWAQRNAFDVLLTVDNKAFNLRLQASVRAKLAGAKFQSIHVCAPSSVWAFSGKQTQRARFSVNHLCTVLPFEDYYWHPEGEDQQVNFVGYFGLESLFDYLGIAQDYSLGVAATTKPATCAPHSPSLLPHQVLAARPALNQLLPQVPASSKALERQALLQRLGIATDSHHQRILLLLPGSRLAEVKTALPVMLQVCEKLGPNVLPIILAASTVQAAHLRAAVPASSSLPPITILGEHEYDKAALFCAANAALAVSGTVVTELLAFACPTVVVYNSGGRLTELIARYKARVNHISLVNIMAGRELVPEFFFNNDVDAMAAQARAALLGQDTLDWEQIRIHLASLVQWNGLNPVRPSHALNRLLVNSTARS